MLLFALLVAACGSANVAPRPVDPRLPIELVAPDGPGGTSLRWEAGQTLEARFTDVIAQLEARGHTVQLPGDARAWPGIRYLTWNMRQAGTTVSHVALVLDDNHDAETDAYFVEAFHHLPATPPAAGHLRRFHIVGPAHGAPAWLFSNRWFGALESALWIDLASLPWDAEFVPRYQTAAAETMARFGLIPDPAPTVEELQVAWDLLHAHHTIGHRPLASLASLALLLGGHLQAFDPRLQWRVGDDVGATFFGQEIPAGPDGTGGGVVRPVDYLLGAWGQERARVVMDYARLLEERLNRPDEAP